MIRSGPRLFVDRFNSKPGNKPSNAPDYHNYNYCVALMQIAYISIDDGAMGLGVHLLGAGEKIRISAYVNFFPFQIRERDAYIAKARAALGDAAFEKAWAEGAALPTEEAVRLALGEQA